MITCDYLIIGSGFAGIGLKYKLSGRTILLDKNPFSYKIGESHVPTLINEDLGLQSLIPKIVRMESYTRKLGTVFCDSYHGKYATNFSTALGTPFAFHCEREEIESLFAKELSVDIRKETIVNIDLTKNTVQTDRNKYHFNKYVLDCSGPAMVIANQLGLVAPVDDFKGMKAQWSYWAIDSLNSGMDSWANWTVINKVGHDSWIWQIPIYKSTILSMGLLHRGEPLANEELIKYFKKRSAACYQLTPIYKDPARAIKPYMKEVHSRFHYSKRSRQCTGKNWILVGDACCFADPVYSTGSGVAMLEAITIANNLNKNKGQFDHGWYDKKCNALIKTVIDGISTWYSGAAFNEKINKKVNRKILQGGFSRHFKPSRITDRARQLQLESAEAFLPSVEGALNDKKEAKVYYFDKSSFTRSKGELYLKNAKKTIRIVEKDVQKVFEKHLLGKRCSYPDLYLLAELNLKIIKSKTYFWKLIRLIELMASTKIDEQKDRLYFLHPEKYEMVVGGLKMGRGRGQHLVFKEPTTIELFEHLKGMILFGKELITKAESTAGPSAVVQQDIKTFLKKFHFMDTFGKNYVY